MVSFIAYNNKGPERFCSEPLHILSQQKETLIFLQDMLQWCGVHALLW